MAVTVPALGSHELGSEAVAGAAGTFDLPTATVTAPTTTVSTGGPDLQVTWTYSQAQEKPQSQYRVIVYNAAETVTYYDSGFVDGTMASHTFDAVEGGVPTDGAADTLSVRVQVRAQGVSGIGISSAELFTIQWGVVTTTVTAPLDLAVITAESITPTWTFASTRSKTQQGYRVRLLGTSSGAVYEDTLVVLSTTATSHALDYLLSDGSSYDVEVTLYNSEGVPGTTTHTIVVQIEEAGSYTDVEEVGTVYEVGVAGQGYMLFDNRDATEFGEFEYRRRTVPLDPPRFATGETPFSQAIERYNFSSLADFRGGAGQTFLNRDTSVDNAYLDSVGVDPFSQPGKLTLLNDMDQEVAETYSGLDLVTVGATLYVQTAAAELTYVTTPGGAENNFTIAAAGTIQALTSDGQLWYAADGTSIFRGGTSDPGAAWATAPAEVLGWAAGRLCTGEVAGSSSTPNRFNTRDDTGAEEITNGRLTLPDDWTITDFAGGSGYVFFSAYAGDRGEIYAWSAGSTDAPFLAYQLQVGDRPLAILYTQGQLVMVSENDGNLSLWRLIVNQDNGTLTPFLVDEYYTGGDATDADLAAYGNIIYFSWKTMATNSGVGGMYLPTSGYAKMYISDTTGEINGVVIWQGLVTFGVVGNGVWTQQSDYVLTGYVRTSIVDGASTLQKVWDTIAVQGTPLASGESWDVAYTVDEGGSYTDFPDATLDTAGARALETAFAKKGPSLGLEVTLNGDGTSTPEVTVITLRYHPLGAADTILVLPIDCTDHVRGLNETELPDSGPGRGAARLRTLEDLIQTRVTVQDIDWYDTRNTEVFELIGIDAKKWSVYNRALGKQQVRVVAICTFRKRVK